MLVDDWTYVYGGWTQVLPTDDPATVGTVRSTVRRILRGWGYSNDELDDAQTVASELTTNAIRHGKCKFLTFRLFLEQHSRAVIDIEDDNPEEPHESESVTEYAESGRGLTIISALAEEWGTVPTRYGKRVFARMPPPLRESE